jgi:hypothetical protein
VSDLYDLQNEWYLKLKEEGFNDIELSWAYDKHIVRAHLPAPHPAGKRTNKKFALSGDSSILLERYARKFIENKRELNAFIDICSGLSLRKAAHKNLIKAHRIVYLVRKAKKQIKEDLKLSTVPEYLRCSDCLDFEEELNESEENND